MHTSSSFLFTRHDCHAFNFHFVINPLVMIFLLSLSTFKCNNNNNNIKQSSVSMTEDKTKPAEHTKTSHESQIKPTKLGFFRRYYYVKDRRRALYAFVVTLLLLALITTLILWLVYRPNSPKFRVISININQLSATYAPGPSVTSNMQFTVLTRNSNRRVSFYYDHLAAFVSYHNLPITQTVNLPPLHHETKSTVAMSPVLGGFNVPVSSEVANELMSDQTNYGAVSLSLVMIGKLRYKGGAFKSGHNGVYVRCDLLVGLSPGFVGQVPLLADSGDCRADV